MKKLMLADWATLVYVAFTTVVLLLMWNVMDHPYEMLSLRIASVAVVCGLAWLNSRVSHSIIWFARLAFPLAMLGVWYPETFEFSRHFPNLDHLFATADLRFFGCEPAYEMCRLLQGKVWSELFNLGYFSYFIFIVLGIVVPLCFKREATERTVFIITAGFFAYYVIYLFLPVAGPQFYYAVIDASTVSAGSFAAVDNYFDLHPDAPIVGNTTSGFFQQLVVLAHQGGERPVAAFPSSHVGMGTVLMILFWKLRRWVCWAALPLYVLLCGATVYIGAHYLVDVFGGWVTAVVFYFFFDACYTRLARR